MRYVPVCPYFVPSVSIVNPFHPGQNIGVYGIKTRVFSRLSLVSLVNPYFYVREKRSESRNGSVMGFYPGHPGQMAACVSVTLSTAKRYMLSWVGRFTRDNHNTLPNSEKGVN